VIKTSTVTSRLMLTGAMAGLCLWTMASRGRSAQDGPAPKESAPSLANPPAQSKPTEKKDETPALSSRESAPGEPPLLERDAAAPATKPPVAEPAQAVDELKPAPELSVPEPLRAGDAAPSSRSTRQPFPSDDPEKDAQAFVDENRKVAEARLKALTDEANKLRARLQKIEAGIRRWQLLLEAMKQHEPSALEPVARNGRADHDSAVTRKGEGPFDAPSTAPVREGLRAPERNVPADSSTPSASQPR